MPDFDYTPLTETTELTDTSIDGRFAGAVATIGDLPAESVAPECFGAVHLPSAVVESGPTTHQWVTGTHTYLETDMGVGWSNALPINAGGGAGPSGANLTLTFASSHTLANAGPIAGILVMVDVNVQRVEGVGGANALILADFRIAINDGSWRGITKTERHINDRGIDAANENQLVSLSIRTLITAADITGGAVSAVRAEIALRRQTATPGNITVILRQAHITALVLRSELS